MTTTDRYIAKGKAIILVAVLFAISAIVLFLSKNVEFSDKEYTIAYESFDTNTMGEAIMPTKKQSKDILFVATIANKKTKKSTLKEVTLVKRKDAEQEATPASPVSYTGPVWRLPTEQGFITQYPSYFHVAYDITSARGTGETIYPVADGIISGIFYDDAGARIVTVNHNINGVYYTSEYVHLAWYAPGIYVGKPVTTNDPLGAMGATGYATGIHLHVTVLDCNLYDPNDPNCATLAGFYNYGRARISQGFYGLGSIINMPHTWYSR